MSPHPTYSPEQLLPAIRDYLSAQNIVRAPSDSNNLPPMWLDPRRGVPYPGQTEGLTPTQSHKSMVIGLYPATGIPSVPYEGFLVKLGAAVWYRGLISPDIQAIHEQIRGALHDKRNLNMNGLLVNESILAREIQRIGSGPEGYTYNCEYMFTLWSNTWVP